MLILKSKAICRKTEFPLLQYQMLLDNMFNQMVEPESLMLKGTLPRSFGTRISRLYTRTTDVIM